MILCPDAMIDKIEEIDCVLSWLDEAASDRTNPVIYRAQLHVTAWNLRRAKAILMKLIAERTQGKGVR